MREEYALESSYGPPYRDWTIYRQPFARGIKAHAAIERWFCVPSYSSDLDRTRYAKSASRLCELLLSLLAFDHGRRGFHLKSSRVGSGCKITKVLCTEVCEQVGEPLDPELRHGLPS